VPHSVPPGWFGDFPWMTCHGPGMCWRSQRLRIGFHVCCPYVPTELWKVIVMVVVSMAARNQWALLCSGSSVVVCASIVVLILFWWRRMFCAVMKNESEQSRAAVCSGMCGRSKCMMASSIAAELMCLCNRRLWRAVVWGMFPSVSWAKAFSAAVGV
jgi:hypothetical protein